MRWPEEEMEARRRELVAEFTDAARGAAVASAGQLRDTAQSLRDFAHPAGPLDGDAPFDVDERSWIVTTAWRLHGDVLAERLGRNPETPLPPQDVIAAGVTLARTLYEIWPSDEELAELFDVALAAAFLSGTDPRWVGVDIDVYGPEPRWEVDPSDHVVWVCHGYFGTPTVGLAEDLLQCDLYVTQQELVAVVADREPEVDGQRVLRQSAAAVEDISYEAEGGWVMLTGDAGPWQLVPDHPMAYATLVLRIARAARQSTIRPKDTP